MSGADRNVLLDIISFLTTDTEVFQKRAYLAAFLTPVNVPSDVLYDESKFLAWNTRLTPFSWFFLLLPLSFSLLDVAHLAQQLQEIRIQFIQVHKEYDEIHGDGGVVAISDLKKEIQLMEEEKQMILNKLARLKRRVGEIPNHQNWLVAARNLRLAQTEEADLIDRYSHYLWFIRGSAKEQHSLLVTVEQRIIDAQARMRDVKVSNSGLSVDNVFQKARDDHMLNVFMSEEKLPKLIESKRVEAAALRSISNRSISIENVRKIEEEISKVQASLMEMLNDRKKRVR